MKRKIGILHPGQMGISVAATAVNSDQEVYWVSQGRSEQTIRRAQKFNLNDAGTLANLCKTCTVLISVCPPHAAEDVAAQILANSYKGLYVDANAISPQRVKTIGKKVADAGAAFVDGGIIGLPAWEPGRTWLYLSGEKAEDVASCFSSGPLETGVVGEAIGKASGLKMCYAAYTKGRMALLCAILATAEKLGVRDELEHQWARGGSDFAEEAIQTVRTVTAKAWRFIGEMDEISATFREAGLPGDFHAGAGDVYRRIAGFKDAREIPSLEAVLTALLQENS
jgi:3-hydroxyisobutyrate dehydrogenase-like beta-hydroxyacid dehydrogenase